MIVLRDSIKERPINLILIIGVIILYIVNNRWMKNINIPVLQHFFVCYFNDLICPLLLLGYSNILLLTVDRELKKIYHILLFCLVAGILWEFLTPFLKKTSVTDYIDILCYLLGGGIYWWVLKLFSLSKE